MEINKDAAEYAKRIWGSQEPAEDFIQTRKGKRSYDDFRAGAIHYLNKLKEAEKRIEELGKAAGEFMSTIPIDNNNWYLPKFNEACEKLKQLLTKQ